ncbi:peptidase domain-containing ABC transporter [Acinetobacter baumannii]|uniref:peptidase domain-containing ABC transporter n=1 Tax=Acinetobacter baumannii TaxID=470 RepID=UPI000951032E|nr:peptidase domain-containing ABC transporter [Acinetobacter baumannii]NDN15830.1 peptidase domain-containing ABC transporter [Acinetobacter baumannii]NDN20892.1 peptidase domain-containing ABC transporter [Acinetobacter baumannii]NDN32478.1 peptidase domain-containing ABC transporter [Acinetobacter baumannii]NDN49443.1 peptidase domain-containing ABC transporter [Acinetobacter baumannii]NDN54780.1 peptidase domain-containing ABC transporter [Acinetobacter baumannii]
MRYLERLSLGLGRTVPVILQTESSECGLACLAMIAGYYGYESDLLTLRQKHPISQKGATLATLVKIANKLHLTTRPLKLELDELNQLRLPCILHWDLNHFVILKNVSPAKITIVDPAFGERVFTYDQASSHFTGIALELWPDSNFEEKKDKTSIRIFKLFGEIRGLWKSLGQILILALVLEVFSLVSPFFMQWVIDHAIVSADLNLLTTLALGFGLLMLLSSLISLLQAWVVMHMATTLNVQWKANIFHHLVNLPTNFFQKRHLGDVISRFSSIDAIQRTLTTSFITAILDGLMTIFTLILMFIYSVKLACIALISMLMYIIIRWIWYYPLRRATEDQIVHGAKQSTHFMETMRGIKTIKQFEKQDYRQATWLSLFVNQINAGLTTQKLNIMFGFVNTLLFGLQNIIIVWLGATLVIEGEFTVGILMAFIAYKNQFGDRVTSLIDKYVEVRMLSLHGERLADIVLTDQEKTDNYLFVPESSELQKTEIDVKSLRFRYSEEESWIIHGINFNIPEGQSVAIVGSTGCGKTTLMNLLLGNLNPEHGEIKIGGQSIKSLGSNRLRNFIAYVAQDDVLFAGFILENISFFDDSVQQDWVEQCAKMASVHDEIMAMPMGYQTLVGDMGNILSGGQKQRILLARALYRKPKILFLDEATSHLDIIKEKEINDMIKSLNITRIIIAHRPETISSVDRIIALNNGRIVSDQMYEPL